MKLWRFIVPLILALSITVPVAASDVSSAVYTGDIVVTNSAGSTQAGSVAFTLNTDNLLSAGYIAPDFSNVAVQNPTLTDAAFMPARSGSDQWLIYVPSILSAQTYRLYTGGTTDMDAKLRYFPGDTGMTVADADSLELGNSFNVEWAGMITSGTTGLLVGKGLAFACTVSSGNANAAIIDTTNTNTTYSADMELYAGADTKYGHARLNVPADSALVQSSWYLKKSGAPTGTININVRNQVTYDYIATLGTLEAASLTDSYKWYDIYGLVVNPVLQDLLYTIEYEGGDASNKVMLGATSGSSGGYRYSTGWAAGQNPPMYKRGESSVYVSTPVPAGDRTIRAYTAADSLYVRCDYDPAVSVAMGGASVPDNTELWRASAGMPYMDYLKITVGGVLRQHIAWENAATFTDLSGNNNHATPTFRTTASSGITSTLTAIEAISPAVAPSGSLGGAINPISAAPTQPTGASWHTPSFDVPIVGDIINDLLDVSNTPYQFFWYPVATVILILLSFAAHKFAVSLFVKTSAVIMAVIIICAFNIFPWLVLPLIAIWNITILVHSQRGVL